MGEIWQQIVVGVIVLGAVTCLWRQATKSRCEKGGCGCDVKRPAAAAREKIAGKTQ